HRTVTCNVEAGVHPEENRTNQVIDRVNTTATTWLGITLECAQCHNHKFDPVSMRDYYQLFAYFYNTPLEVELPSSATDVSHDFVGPYLELTLSVADGQQLQNLTKQLNTLKTQREHLAASAREQPDTTWTTLPVTTFGSTGSEDVSILDDHSVLLSGAVPDKATYTITLQSPATPATAFRLETLTHPTLPGSGPGRGDPGRNNFVLHEISLVAGDTPVPLGSASADFSQAGWPSAAAVDNDPKTGWAIAPQFSRQHWLTFRPATPIPPATQLTFTLTQNFGRGRVIGRPRISSTSVAPGQLPPPGDALAALDASITATTAEIDALTPDKTLVMVELPDPRPTHIMDRGNYLTPLAKVDAGTPTKLHPIDPSLPANRLGLARWITSPENPLTARVTVNRWWAELFGHGLVATLEDFGTQAAPPTHPALLDWLAVELVESGWDMKHILKLITSSATYAQSSHITPQLLTADPANQLYARAPRFRLAAEAIRDNALSAAGLLSTSTGGAPVMPHQPPGLWRQTGRNEPVWKNATGEDRFRRGIYIVYRRAAPYPSFTNFDAPDRATCTTRRPRTNTPLQALTLLNDPAYTEIAVALADRALTEQPSDPVARIFQLVLNRLPSTHERSVLASLPGPPDNPTRLIASASPVYQPKTTDTALLASHFHIAQAILNLDEAITKP
ncbi:MAG: DUF1553 domain-containing protein, partial [Verrucomicrobiales bacterium]|nr:DUF1553 domain-containing protein [Verrucomicrobiales bacterium]